MRFLAWAHALAHMIGYGEPLVCEPAWHWERPGIDIPAGTKGYDIPAVACGYDGFSFKYFCTYKGCWGF